jgi:hypothetical protein
MQSAQLARIQLGIVGRDSLIILQQPIAGARRDAAKVFDLDRAVMSDAPFSVEVILYGFNLGQSQDAVVSQYFSNRAVPALRPISGDS